MTIEDLVVHFNPGVERARLRDVEYLRGLCEQLGITIHAGIDDIYRAANEVDFSESWIIRCLFWLRGLSTENITLESLRKSRFEVLGEKVNRELLLGLVGRFWTIGGDMKKIDARTFKSFDTAGYAKAVWNFAVSREGVDTKLTTETRVKCLDAQSRRSFGFYWTVVRPFSGLIRMEMLRLIKRRAESCGYE